METMEPTESKESLEELFEQLGNILADMENPELSLENAFMLYEQGMKKIQRCNQKLDTVEKKMLQIAEDGTEVPFEYRGANDGYQQRNCIAYHSGRGNHNKISAERERISENSYGSHELQFPGRR